MTRRILARTGRHRTRRREPGPYRVALVGLLVLGGLALLVGTGLRASSGLPGLKYATVYAEIPEIGSLKEHDEVRIAGVRVGQVIDQQVVDGRARLELQLQPDAGALPADSKVAVRSRGLLGTRFLEVLPGRSATVLGKGGTINGGRDTFTHGVPETLDLLDEETRGSLGTMVGGLGQGLLGRGGQLSDALDIAPTAGPDFYQGARVILASRPGAVRRLRPSLDAGIGVLDGAREDIIGGLDPAARSLQVFTDEREAMQDALEQAPATLTALDRGLTRGRPLLAAARSLAAAAETTLPKAPGGLRATTALLRESPQPLDETRALLARARTSVPAALKVTRALSPVLDPVKRLAATLDPAVSQLGLSACDIVNFAENWRSTLGMGASGGGEIGDLNTFRLTAVSGAGVVSGFGDALPSQVPDRNVYSSPCQFSPGGPYPLGRQGGR
jgi:phospholipid/cholesterol/gamma-HCH transport system substrate-binding protein